MQPQQRFFVAGKHSHSAAELDGLGEVVTYQTEQLAKRRAAAMGPRFKVMFFLEAAAGGPLYMRADSVGEGRHVAR